MTARRGVWRHGRGAAERDGRIRAGRRFEHGAWSLGGHYRRISPLAVAWIAVVCVLFLMPVSPKGIPGAAGFDRNVVNYAP